MGERKQRNLSGSWPLAAADGWLKAMAVPWLNQFGDSTGPDYDLRLGQMSVGRLPASSMNCSRMATGRPVLTLLESLSLRLLSRPITAKSQMLISRTCPKRIHRSAS